MKDRRRVVVGGDEFEVTDEGNCFIETKRHRYSWREGELKDYRWEERPVTPYVDADGSTVKAVLAEAHKVYTGRDIVELYGPDYDKGRGHKCWIKFMGDDRAMNFPAPKIEVVIGATVVPDSNPVGKKSKQRRHGPDNRPSYIRRTNPELGNQLAGFFRHPKNKDASVNAGATWAKELFARSGGAAGKGGPLNAFKEPCPSVLWRESKKQKEKMRYKR